MKKSASLSTPQFSDRPTELDHMIEDFVASLDKLAVDIQSILSKAIDLAEDQSKPIISVASRLASQATLFDSAIGRINNVHDEIDKIKSIIDQGGLMCRDTYTASRDNVNDSSVFIENHINRAKGLLKYGSPYKEAFDQMMLVAIEYFELVKKFNEAVVSYNKLHSTNLTGAKADLLIKKGKGPWKSAEEFDDYITALYAEIAMDHFEKEHFAEADAMSDEEGLKIRNARRAKFGLPPTTMEEYLA